MAKIVFLKEGEVNQKKDYVPASAKLRKELMFWRIIIFLETLTIILIIKHS